MLRPVFFVPLPSMAIVDPVFPPDSIRAETARAKLLKWRPCVNAATAFVLEIGNNGKLHVSTDIHRRTGKAKPWVSG